ncbi:MAG: hypothetical protein ACJASY_003359, partial [Halioglobus sp.]
MALEVIGAGFGRTDTTSLQAALHQLGYAQCHHRRKVLASSRQVDHFLAAAHGDKMDWDGVFDGRFTDRQHAVNVFEENTKEVKRAIHEHRLLVHDAREGWEPLCKFLNKPVPETPYPLT